VEGIGRIRLLINLNYCKKLSWQNAFVKLRFTFLAKRPRVTPLPSSSLALTSNHKVQPSRFIVVCLMAPTKLLAFPKSPELPPLFRSDPKGFGTFYDCRSYEDNVRPNPTLSRSRRLNNPHLEYPHVEPSGHNNTSSYYVPYASEAKAWALMRQEGAVDES
jgi:hypothetical protein